MKDEIKNTFEGLTEPVHPGFRTQLRSRLEQGRPRRWTSLTWLAPALATLALIAVIGGVVLLLGGRPQAAAIPATPQPATPSAPSSPTPPTSPAPEASTVVVPNPDLTPFQCGGMISGGQTPTMPVTPIDVRLGGQTGYDRFVIQTNTTVPTWQVTPQASTTFTQDGSGQIVTLAGTRGILVRLHGAGPQSNGTWQKGLTLATNGGIREAREIGNFEAVFSWGLGVDGTGCFRAFTLSSPDRLVVDVQAP